MQTELIIYISIGVVVGVALVFLFVGRRDKGKQLLAINKRRTARKEERKQEILEAVARQGRITNDDVEKMFDVSDATATNYLEELENEGKLKQRGETGRGVFYEPF